MNGSATEQSNGANGHGLDGEHLPDLMGQFPVLNAYSQLTFGFELPHDVAQDAVLSALQGALDRLIEQIPWLGWQMGEVSGIRTAVPWPAGEPRQLLIAKDCHELIAPMSQLLAAGVPISKLDGKALTPWPALPFPRGLPKPDPIITLQANFITGGVILNLSSHHTMMDGTANFQVLKLLGTLLSGEEIPEAELKQANRDRSRLIELIPRSEPLKDHSHLRKPPGYQFVFPPSPPTWCYFKMPVASLAKLAKTVQDPARPVTEDDVLHALYWQRLCAVRLARGAAPDTLTKISRAIDGRMALGVPAAYMGAQVYIVMTRLPMGQVASLTLQQTAQVLRREFSQGNTAWAVRSYATFIAREADRSALMYNGTHDGTTDVGATSSLNTNQSLGSWGPLLGACKFFRRSTTTPIPGAFSVQSAEGGAIPICVCLPQDDLEALKKDTLWRQYARCVG